MLRFTRYHFMFPLWVVISFSFGFSSCLIFSNKLKTSGWAESFSAIATIIAVALAVITYRSWKNEKIREDAYSTTRAYISTLSSIERTLIEINNQLYRTLPLPGNIVPSEKSAAHTLDNIYNQNSELRSLTLNLTATSSELQFWGVSLSNTATLAHDTLIKALSNYLNYVHHLHNSLQNLYIHKVEDNYSAWHKLLAEQEQILFKSFEDRKKVGIQGMFNF